MMKGRLRKELESTVVIVRSMLDIPRTTGTVKDSLILYQIRQWTVGCGASEVGRLQIRKAKLARTKLIPIKFSLIFKDSTVGMKVPVDVYCCTRALRALYNLWLYWECQCH